MPNDPLSILVVEDNADIAALLDAALKSEGYQVGVASCGTAALEGPG